MSKPATPIPVKPTVKSNNGIAKSPVKTAAPKTSVTKKHTETAAPSQHVPVQKETAQVPIQSQGNRDSIIKITQPDMPAVIPYVLRTRTNSLLKTINVNHNMIEIRIYDDGAIDNDTVSVYYDNKLIISRARLTDQPITAHIRVDPSDHPHQLVMVAENLGDIPPNTSLMVVNDGDKKYEERIISTEQNNVMIDFVYKKIE
jgi:hypothetical protein